MSPRIPQSLGEIVSISKGKKHELTDAPDSRSKRLIGIDDLRNDDHFRYTNDGSGTESISDDVLIAWDGANAGTIGFGKTGYIGSTIARLRVKSGVRLHTPFFGLYLRSKFEYLRQTATGATIPHVSRSALESLPVPNIAFDDQIRIAHLLGKVEGLIAQRKQHLQQLDDLLKSVFLEMFGDPVRNEKGWEKRPLSELATVRIGPFGSLLHAEDYITGGIPLINPSHMVNGEIVVDELLTITEVKFQELSAYHLALNDVVVARRGEIGRCALVRNKTKLLCGTGSMFVRVTSEYLPIMLQFMIYRTPLKDYLESNAKGVTMKNLNSSILEKMQVIVPPPEIQTQFAAIVEKVEGIKSRYQKSLTDLEALYGALSQQAFKGELDLSRVSLLGIEPEKEQALATAHA